MFMFQDDRLMKPEKSRGDQTVEIILATTALVTVTRSAASGSSGQVGCLE